MAPEKPLIEIAIETLKAEVNLLEKKKNKLTSGENYLQSQIKKEKRKKISGQQMILRKMLRKLIKL